MLPEATPAGMKMATRNMSSRATPSRLRQQPFAAAPSAISGSSLWTLRTPRHISRRVKRLQCVFGKGQIVAKEDGPIGPMKHEHEGSVPALQILIEPLLIHELNDDPRLTSGSDRHCPVLHRPASEATTAIVHETICGQVPGALTCFYIPFREGPNRE
jgi:hypothetical protein